MREFVDTAAEIQAHYDMLLDIRNQVAQKETVCHDIILPVRAYLIHAL